MSQPHLVTYLLLPRPGPYYSAGKTAFFATGVLVGLVAPDAAVSVAKFFVAFVCYELLVSHGKYLINDFFGRGSDHHFARSACNQFPQGRVGVALASSYTVLRLSVGTVGFGLATGSWAAAGVPLATIVLQVLYDLAKQLRFALAAGLCFSAVSLNYGVRAVAGVVAIGGSVLVFSPYAGLAFAWGVCVGSQFLGFYWLTQASAYLGMSREPDALSLAARHYKPMLISFWGQDDRVRIFANVMFALMAACSGAICWVVSTRPLGLPAFVSLVVYLLLSAMFCAAFISNQPVVTATPLRIWIALGAVASATVAVLGESSIALGFALIMIGASGYGLMARASFRASQFNPILQVRAQEAAECIPNLPSDR